ncbi:hypothetical protein Maeo_0543 [Methanococcus aeolicus Nankai-3]|uniref:Uncharacterized protein n=1 Tax=Methanococcus aeolicus (strain ATCC BAA-1280 / DSM 17508 / OCM 812 / Nankai-3) TaxID=419665 RepID=A6UUF6_META3|nr:hypothetical protein Maeo_0543 [Methanococcus aeolicus Nankai-3]
MKKMNGIKDVCSGAPIKVGKNGIEEVVPIKISDDELMHLNTLLKL